MPETPERTFTEAEHQAILETALAREIAAATAEKDQQVADLQARIDVLEAEKASLNEDKSKLQEDFDAYKAGVEEAKAREGRRVERVDRVKAAAQLPDAYFTDERVARWVAMSDEAFDALVSDFAEVAMSRLSPEQRVEIEGLSGEERERKLAELAGVSRETAAFTAGKDGGTKVTTETPAPALRSFMSARYGGGS